MQDNFILRKVESKTEYTQFQNIESFDLSLQEQFLCPSSSESDLQQQIPQFNYVSNKLLHRKPKPSFTTPFNKFHDKEELRKEHSNKKAELMRLRKVNKELRDKYLENTLLRRELEEALFKLSQALPSSSEKESYFITKEKDAIEAKNTMAKVELMKLKRSSKATYKQEFNILKQYLQSHTVKLTRELDSVIKQEHLKSKQKSKENPKQRRKRSTQLESHEEDLTQLVDQIQTIKNQWMINLKCNLLNQKLEQDNSSIKLKDARIKNTMQEIKRKKELLQFIKLENAGLAYQEQISVQNRESLSVIQQEIQELKLNSQKKESMVMDLRTTLADRTNVYQYVKKWNEDLMEKLEEKKRSEQQVKSTLEARINSLSKEFEEWNSKCKTLVMEDQAMKLGKNLKQFKINSKFNSSVKARLIKQYQVEPIFKRINYELTLQSRNKQEFIDEILGDLETISIKKLYQNIKSSNILGDQYHPDFLKASKYVVEDNIKQFAVSTDTNFIEKSKAKLILSHMIGNVISEHQMIAENKRILDLMKTDYWNIREKLPLTDLISQQRFKESFLFLGNNFLTTTFKAICIKMFEFEKGELNKYPLYAFKMMFQKYAVKRSDHAEGVF